MKILFIPYIDREGTAERVPNLIRILSKRHQVVGLPPVSLRSSIPALNPLYKMCERLYEPWKMSRLSKGYSDVDLIFASQNRSALPASIISRKLKRPLIFDSHGNPQLLCDNLNAGPLFRIRNILPEKHLRGRIKKLITVSKYDEDAYIKMGFDKDIIKVIPTCINFDNIKINSKKESRNLLNLSQKKTIILFFASYNYKPNIEAVTYINQKLAPAIPDAEIILAGSGKITERLRPNIRFLGFVEDLSTLINASDICISPIWHGVGILEKALLMMAYGKPTVVTSFVKRGIPELKDGHNCLLAQSNDEFIEKIQTLIHKPETGGSLGTNAKELIISKYNWSLYEEQLFRVIQEL